jgi:hypothetical protein
MATNDAELETLALWIKEFLAQDYVSLFIFRTSDDIWSDRPPSQGQGWTEWGLVGYRGSHAHLT